MRGNYSNDRSLGGMRRFTLIDHDVVRGIDPDERRHGYLEQFVLVAVWHLNGPSFSAETNLAVAAFDLKHVYKHVLIDSSEKIMRRHQRPTERSNKIKDVTTVQMELKPPV